MHIIVERIKCDRKNKKVELKYGYEKISEPLGKWAIMPGKNGLDPRELHTDWNKPQKKKKKKKKRSRDRVMEVIISINNKKFFYFYLFFFFYLLRTL